MSPALEDWGESGQEGGARDARVDELTKRYGEVVALNGCSFRIPPGRIVGFLGPNGAGKTTAMRCIFGLEQGVPGPGNRASSPGRGARAIVGPMPAEAPWSVDVPEIETPRLRLRGWRFEDIEALARVYADPEVERRLHPMTREETEEQVAYFVAHWEAEGFGPWAVEERASGRMGGRIGLLRHVDFVEEPDPVEVGWTLDPGLWGRGLATEGGLASLRFGFEALGVSRIISITLPTNAASRRVMEKCGLTYEGATVWRGLEHVWYATDRDRWEAARA